MEPVGMCGDRIVPLSQLSLPVSDAGFVHGVTVAEQVRTFRQRPFLLEMHYQRWCRGLAALGLQPVCSVERLTERIEKLVSLNSRLLATGAEQGICFFATPGPQVAWNWPDGDASTSVAAGQPQSTFYAHTYPLPVQQWQNSYRDGVHLVSSQVRQVPQECWPADIKVRSRLHYYMAQIQCRRVLPGSHPILLDDQGNVSDSAIGSIVGYTHSQGLIVRRSVQRYASISLLYTIELARKLGVAVTERDFSVVDLQEFDEAYLVSTPWCILPVRTVDSKPLGDSSFCVFRRLIQAWSDQVGVDLVNP